LLDHLPLKHEISAEEYLVQFKGSPTISLEFSRKLEEFRKNSHKAERPRPKFHVGNIPFEIHLGVPEKDCLPLPEHYMFPTRGKLLKDITHASISLASGRSLYISGISGSGKDAFIHALSHYTRRPTELFQITPNSDISSWLYSRAFDEKGTRWEEGRLLTCVRDGYTNPMGQVIPYLILLSDLDRADKSQIEILRLILDSIQGRIKGPKGETYPILPGTQIVATANTTGGGDNRGQYISANPLDSSIISRFHAGFEFHWLDWEDEKLILEKKFPTLIEKVPHILEEMEVIVESLRAAIMEEELFCDFSHRDLCSWLQHAEDYLIHKGLPKKLLRITQRAWIDRLPDQETKIKAKRIIDPKIKGGSV